jgi:formiminoglutamate deiminase
MPNLHSHAFQRGMAGLAERRGASSDSFWTWREIMYRFVDRMTPDDVRAIAAMAYVEMLEAGFTRVGEFHYLHHDLDGQPFADRAEMSGAVLSAAGETGIGMTLLPVLYSFAGFGAQAPQSGRRASSIRSMTMRVCSKGRRPMRAPCPMRWSGSPAQPARGLARATPRARAARPASPGAHPHCRAGKEVADCLAWSGRVRSNGCSTMRRWMAAGASSMRPT